MKCCHGLRLVFVATVILLLLAPCTKARDDKDPGKEQRIRALVELLASKNPAPRAKQGDITVPKNYDTQAQVVVYLATQQLMVEAADAFDVLAEHLNDERYSFSYLGINGDSNMTVGGACHWIMRQTVECYASEIHLMTRDQDYVYLYRDPEKFEMAKWWKANRKRPLWELQIEAIDHQIKFMKTVDREKASTPFIDGRLAEPAEFERLRKENLRILEKLKTSIETMKEPFRPKVLDLQRAWMGLLPWRTINPGA